MSSPTSTTTNVAIQDVIAAAAEGVIRALDARKISAGELVQSGFGVSVHIIAGGIRERLAINPQSLQAERQ
jgi:hypothetical protein